MKTAALLCENSIRFLVQGCQISATLIIRWIFNQHSKTANYPFLSFPPLWPALPPAGAGTNALNSPCNKCFPKQNLTFIKLMPRQHSPKTMTPSSKSEHSHTFKYTECVLRGVSREHLCTRRTYKKEKNKKKRKGIHCIHE